MTESQIARTESVFGNRAEMWGGSTIFRSVSDWNVAPKRVTASYANFKW